MSTELVNIALKGTGFAVAVLTFAAMGVGWCLGGLVFAESPVVYGVCLCVNSAVVVSQVYILHLRRKWAMR